MSGAESTVRALLWIDQQEPMDDAEMIVRLARPTRWPRARFAPSDVARASKAVRSDPGYRAQIVKCASDTVGRAGIGLKRLIAAERAVTRGGIR